MVNYESVLISHNETVDQKDKLALIYPTSGVITADYPITALGHINDQAKKNFEAVVGYLCQAAIQNQLMTVTHRRPSRSDVPLASGLVKYSVPELSPPASLAVADGLIRNFGNTIRRPARTIYVLDVSGSMDTVDAPDPTRLSAGDQPKISRIAALRSAMLSLTGADRSLPAEFVVFHEREQVILLTFSTEAHPPQHFQVPSNGPESELQKISQAVNEMKTGGNTAIYGALIKAYELAGEPVNEDRYTTIVLFSDGQRTTGPFLDGFRTFYKGLPLAQRQVPVFAVLLGEGNVAEMTAVSQEVTGGEFFDARQKDSLSKVFQDIRGYQ